EYPSHRRAGGRHGLHRLRARARRHGHGFGQARQRRAAAAVDAQTRPLPGHRDHGGGLDPAAGRRRAL
ncbi:MAG: hypothetical protein AVDCRST_MAG31-1381, partial [uncultured Sphingomonas sp.]